MSQRVIVLEINEIPLRIYRHFQKLRPGSAVDTLMKSSVVIETVVRDVDQNFLYPSQTWASLNTGAPYSLHKIHWYNDPKPAEYPLYWKTLANRGFSVGVVNSLHSSPAESYAAANDSYKFLLPDCFAPDSYTKPGYFEPFQTLNLKAVSSNTRVTRMRLPFREAALSVLNSPRYGIRFRTLLESARLMYGILCKKVNREQFRNLQFPLVADIFLNLVCKHQPDVALMFTNHVAGNMHRYWYALFPEDYPAAVYDANWLAKYSREIDAAIDLLNGYLGEMMELARQTDRVLVVVSSMGQHANQKLTPEYRQARTHAFRLEDVHKFVGHFTTRQHSFQVDSAMVPQYTLTFRTAAEAAACAAEMHAAMEGVRSIDMRVDQNGEVVTITAILSPAQAYVVQGRSLQYSDLGFVRFEVDDHHSGCHSPEGSLIIYNSRTAKASQPSIDYLEYAPALLSHFGVPRTPYMTEPSFSF